MSRSQKIFAILLLLGLLLTVGFTQYYFGLWFPLSVVALMLGFIFELHKRVKNWSAILVFSLVVFVLSLYNFFFYKHEVTYDIITHVARWPFVICGLMLLFSTAFFYEHITEPITEGVVLMQSLSFIYWLYALGWLGQTHGIFVYCFLLVCAGFVLFSLFHAFSYARLFFVTRLFLSLWNTMVVSVLGIYQIYRMYHHEAVEQAKTINGSVILFAQYFLLGASVLYILNSILLLVQFLPSRSQFFNQEYFQDVRASGAFHAMRVSEQQVRIWESCFCLILTLLVYGFNEYYQVLPWYHMVWAVFVTFPILLKGIYWLKPLHIDEELNS